ALHLAALFVVAMVCHGELARDRPDPEHLTEYFLWMSLGGVAGGLFNALLAPLVFNSLAEYPLALVAACLLLPTLGDGRVTPGARTPDLALAATFLVLGAGLIAYKRFNDPPSLRPLLEPAGLWCLAGVAALLVLGGLAAWRRWEAPSLDPSPEAALAARVATGALPAELHPGTKAPGEEGQDTWVDRAMDVG